MKPHRVEPGTSCHRLPWPLQISTRLLGIVARHDIRAKPTEASQDCKRWSVQDHGLPAGLRVGQKQQPAFQSTFPFEVQDFTEPTAVNSGSRMAVAAKGTDL